MAEANACKQDVQRTLRRADSDFGDEVDETHEGYDYGADKIDESGNCATDVAPYADQATQQHFRNYRRNAKKLENDDSYISGDCATDVAPLRNPQRRRRTWRACR